MTGEGHEDQFPPPSLRGRCQFGQGTFARIGGKEEDAPEPAIRGIPLLLNGRFLKRTLLQPWSTNGGSNEEQAAGRRLPSYGAGRVRRRRCRKPFRPCRAGAW